MYRLTTNILDNQKAKVMTKEDREQLKLGVDHIMDSGASSIRFIELIESFIEKRYASINDNDDKYKSISRLIVSKIKAAASGEPTEYDESTLLDAQLEWEEYIKTTIETP